MSFLEVKLIDYILCVSNFLCLWKLSQKANYCLVASRLSVALAELIRFSRKLIVALGSIMVVMFQLMALIRRKSKKRNPQSHSNIPKIKWRVAEILLVALSTQHGSFVHATHYSSLLIEATREKYYGHFLSVSCNAYSDTSYLLFFV